MKKINYKSGFSVVELLITLFIAAAFLMSGYQLYSAILKNGIEVRANAKASNVVYNYLQRYKSLATSPCTAQTPLTNSSIAVDSLSDVTVTVALSCPYSAITSISKVQVTLKYNDPQQTLTNATYVKP